MLSSGTTCTIALTMAWAIALYTLYAASFFFQVASIWDRWAPLVTVTAAGSYAKGSAMVGRVQVVSKLG